MKKIAIYTSSIFTLFVIWLFLYVFINQPLLMPSPIGVLVALFDILTSITTISVIFSTVFRLLLAIGVAIIMGIIFGVFGSRYKGLSIFFHPYITILRTIPVISFVVIILIVFGFSSTPYIITFLMVFPLIYQAIHDGIRGIDPSLIDVYKLEDNHLLTGIKYCYLPLIKSHITTAFLQSAGLGIKVLVMAEYLSQTPNSIGREIYFGRINLNYDFVFAWTILLIILAIIIESLIIKYQNR